MATLAEIAKKANVSPKTVSNVLNADRTVMRSDAVRRSARIHRIAQEMGYRLNAAARATRQGRFCAVGILQSTDSSRGGIPQSMLYGIQQQAAAQNMHLSMGLVPDTDLADPAGMPKVLREWCVDGLLISYTADFPPIMLQHIERYRLPAIWLNVKLDYDCVHPDDFGGAAGATEILLEHGHRRIAYLGPKPVGSHYSLADRCRGYAYAMTKAGLTPRMVYQDFIPIQEIPDPATCIQPLVDLLRSPDRPTAVLVMHNVTDLLFAAHLAGLSVPRDLSVVVMSDGANSVMGIKPAQMRLHSFGVGYRAFGQLQEKIREPSKPLDPVAVFCTFDAGQTVAPPPQR